MGKVALDCFTFEYSSKWKALRGPHSLNQIQIFRFDIVSSCLRSFVGSFVCSFVCPSARLSIRSSVLFSILFVHTFTPQVLKA